MALTRGSTVRELIGLLPFALAGVSLTLASILAESAAAIIATVAIGIFLSIGLTKSSRHYLGFFIFGLVFSAGAFYWLPRTISFFGGFPELAGWALFSLYCASASIQFLFCAWIYQGARRSRLEDLSLALPLAWMASELLFPRLFPWRLGHCLVAWQSIAGSAEFFGVLPLSGLVIWWGQLVVKKMFCADKVLQPRKSAFFSCAVFSLILLSLGFFGNHRVQKELSAVTPVKVALIQGNLAAKEKGDVKFFDANLDRYRELTAEAKNLGAELVFWPESVLNHWISDTLESFAGKSFDPMPNLDIPLILGGLSYRRRSDIEVEKSLEVYPEAQRESLRESLTYHKFNSAFARGASGEIHGRYHKRALMPFGEYLPFADKFPLLREISPQTGDFTVGDLLAPLRFNLPSENNPPKTPSVVRESQRSDARELRIGVLICYEDLVPELSQNAARLGANLLVNLTNDAWYGETAAPFQHHLLAQWRAIETRKYLLRVTNTGYTAVVDPFGKTVSGLPIFEEGVLVWPISLLGRVTFYALIGEVPFKIASWLLVIFAWFVRRR